MGEKKEKPPKSKIEIQTRKPEKRGIFANLGSDRQKNDHPLREILNFPSEVDSQSSSSEISKDDSSGYPALQQQDSQNNIIGYSDLRSMDSQTENSLDSQHLETGYPDNSNLDSQLNLSGYPPEGLRDSQSIKSGYPDRPEMDILLSKEDHGLSKRKGVLDSMIAGQEILDSQKKEKKQDWKKYDKARRSKGVFLRTNEEITKKFKQFCIANDWDFSQGTELAWNKLMNDLDSQPAESLDSLISQDDRRLKMIFKTKGFIINLYLRYNSIFNELSGGNGKKWNARWSPRDDETAQRYNDLPTAVIELGILQTQIQKGFRTSRIQSFKYYTDEIEKVLASGVSDEMLDTILNYHRQIWKNQTGREVDLSFLENQRD